MPRTRAVSFTTFREDAEAVYALTAKKTAAKVRQVLGELADTRNPKTGKKAVKTTADVKPKTIAWWRQAHPDRAPATVDSLMRSLRSACEVGVASGYWASNPLGLKTLWPDTAPPDDEGPIRHHSIDEIRRVLLRLQEDAVLCWRAHRTYTVGSIVALTGVRKMECLRLHVADVDLVTPCLKIRARRKLKTRASAQPVGAPPELLEVIRWWLPVRLRLVREAGVPDCPWLIPGATGKSYWEGGPPGQRPLDRLKAAGEAVGVKGFTFQSLRHSWATHAERWGFGETLIQRQLRHTTIRTQQTYRHSDLPNLVEATSRVRIGIALADRFDPARN